MSRKWSFGDPFIKIAGTGSGHVMVMKIWKPRACKKAIVVKSTDQNHETGEFLYGDWGTDKGNFTSEVIALFRCAVMQSERTRRRGRRRRTSRTRTSSGAWDEGRGGLHRQAERYAWTR